MILRFAISIAIAAFLGSVVSDSAQSASYVLRYETLHYGSLLKVFQHHAITQRIDAKQLSVSIYAYRLDQKTEAGQPPDSAQFGKYLLGFSEYHRDSLDLYRKNVLETRTAKALLDHSLVYLGKIDTIAGLPSHKFAIEIKGNREYFIWLAAAPAGLDNFLLWQTIEYQKRTGSFLLEEELCNMIRLILLRGIDFPPDLASGSTAFVLTRFDTAVNPEFLNFRDNSYLYELKSITVITTAKD